MNPQTVATKFLTITVSSIYGLKHYRINRTALKTVLAILSLLFLMLLISICVNLYTTRHNNQLYSEKQNITDRHKKLTQTHQELVKDHKNLNQKFLQSNIEIDYLKHLLGLEKKQLLQFDSKLTDFENKIKLRMPIKKHSAENINLRLQIAKQTIEERQVVLSTIPNGYPFKTPPTISSGFGSRIHPIKKVRHMHNGTDYLVPLNTPISATADGIVKFVGYQNGYGKTIIIAHNLGFQTLFAHLNTMKVKKHDFVKKNQVIALSGNTGLSTGPHLHYGIQYKNNFLNPRDFVSWNLYNYNLIFKKKNQTIPWQSLISLIQNQITQYRKLHSPLAITSGEISE